MQNSEVVRIFRDISSILQIKGENPFRIRAYERAAQNIESLNEELSGFLKRGALSEIPGIGKDLADKIKEYAATGKIKMYQKLKRSVPAGLLDLLGVPSLGPKTVKLLYEKLKIKSIPQMEAAIKKNKLRGIFGIKEKTAANILKGIEILKRGRQRLPLAQADLIAQEFLKPLKNLPEVKKISVAGSLRRQKETIRDIDILAVSNQPQKLMRSFISLPQVKDVQARGETKSSVRTADGVQVDCRAVKESSYGAALIYFTGSKNFNISLRQLAIKKGLKINEYGIFSVTKGGVQDRFIAGKTEEEVFKTLGLQYIEPELREDTGELELAKNRGLPELLQLKDIKGDLHVHSEWSDGADSIEQLALAAKKLGYSYIAVTDHSQGLKIAGGLTPAELTKKKKEIEKINKKIKDFRVLFGTEAEISSSGKIDYKEETLKQFDIVIAAIHSGFKQSKEQLTERIIRACANKYVHIIAHPTGRLWGTREAYEVDLDKIFRVAKETNTCLEINAFLKRMDLNGSNAARGRESGARFAIGTDSHSVQWLGNMRFGVSIARRGWLTAGDVINTLSVDKLLKTIRK